MSRSFALILVLAGCASEQEILTGLPDWGAPNPAEYVPPVQTDRIRQVENPAVDVLWVVDNSRSMKDDADKLKANFPLFFDAFDGSGLDYHIGVISTNMDTPSEAGQLRAAQGHRFVDPTTPDAATVFAEMVPYQSGILSHEESGREAIHTAIAVRSADTNAGFFRDEAALHVVVVSDENDHSAQPPLSEFVPWLQGLRAPGELSFNSIVGVTVPCNGSYERGDDYIAVSEEIGGFVWSICDLDWSDSLDRLGLQAAGLRKEYFLSRLPVVDSLEVQVELTDGTTLPFEDGWTYVAARNSILFDDYVPDPLATIVIRYTVLAAE